MKRTLKIIVVAAFTVLGIALIPTIDTDAKLVSWDADASSSRALYVQNCARCHGADGKAQTALGKKLEADDISGGLSTSKVTRVVTSGRGEMPSFKKRLSKAQIASIAGYVHSL